MINYIKQAEKENYAVILFLPGSKVIKAKHAETNIQHYWF